MKHTNKGGGETGSEVLQISLIRSNVKAVSSMHVYLFLQHAVFSLYFCSSFLLHAVSRSEVIVGVSGWFYREILSGFILSVLELKSTRMTMAGNIG